MGAGNSSMDIEEESIKEYWMRKKKCERKTVDFMEYVEAVNASAERFAEHITRSNDHDERRAIETEIAAKYFLCTSKTSLGEKKRSVVEELAEFIEFISEILVKRAPNVTDACPTCDDLRKCTKKSAEWTEISNEAREELHFNKKLKEEISAKEKQIESLVEECRKFPEEQIALQNLTRKHDDEMDLKENIHTKKMKDLEQKMEDKHNSLVDRLKGSEKINEDLRSQLKQMKEQNQNTSKQMSESNNLQLEKMADDHSRRLKEVSDNNELKSDQLCVSHSNELRIQKQRHEDYSTGLERQIHDLEDQLQDISNTKEQLSIECEKMSTLTNALKDQLQSNEQKNRDLNNEISEYKKKYTNDTSYLKSSIDQLKNDCSLKDKMYSELDAKTKKRQAELESEILDKDIMLANQNAEIENNKSTIADMNIEIASMKAEIADSKTEITKLKTVIEDRETKIVKIKCEIADKETEIANKEVEIARMKSEIAGNEAEIATKTTNVIENEIEIAKKKAEIDKKNIEILKFQRSEGTYRTKINGLEILKTRNEQEVKDAEARIKSMQRTIESITTDIQVKIKECDNLQAELREEQSAHAAVSAELLELRRKSIIRVKLFCLRRVNIMSDFENDLMAQLKSKIETEHKELVFEQLTDTKDDDVESDTDPTIVLCLSASRIGTDAINAVHGLHLSSKKALLMIHHKDVHALPQQSSERVLTGEDFRNLGCISDMAFLSGKGIFQCEINTSSILKLVSFIKKEGVEHKKY